VFGRILMPLDGSRLAEAAIAYGAELTARLGSELILLHVYPSEQQSFIPMHQLYLREVSKGVQSYIEKRFPRCEDWTLRTEILRGEPADTIREYIEKNDIKLTIVTSHGSSGFKFWWMGSVADKVVRAVNTPVLLIRVKEPRPVEGKKNLINRILVSLDGSKTSEMAVPYAVELAKSLRASITLYRMVEGKALTSDTDAYAPMVMVPGTAKEEKRVRSYLNEVESGIRAKGIPVTHKVTLGADAAAEILEQEKTAKVDLVIMAGRGGSTITRWAFGSVAQKILFEGELPLLLVRKPLELI